MERGYYHFGRDCSTPIGEPECELTGNPMFRGGFNSVDR
jgi:hypothetical protein